jgi:deazaflavin-dependent oxidoreductase (nitroreductase family)
MGLARQKPSGFLRWALRAPIALYRLRLGWLLTGHFLMLVTTGRKTGQPRYAVIEVVRHDKASGVYIIAAGWGSKSDWYQNILKTPRVRVEVGLRRFEARAVPLPEEEARWEIEDYARRFPLPFRQLSKTLLGEAMTGTPEECARLAQIAPLVALIQEVNLQEHT